MKTKLLILANVDWFFLSHRLPIALAAKNAGYEVHIAVGLTDQYEMLCSYGFAIHPLPLLRGKNGLLSEINLFVAIIKILRSVKPDVLHLVTIKPVLYGGIAARLTQVPAVVSAISGLGFVFIKNGVWLARLIRVLALFLYKQAFRHPNLRVIFQNINDKQMLINATGLAESKTTLIRGSGVNLVCYCVLPEPEGIPVVAMAARLLRDKGVFEFVEAARIIKRKGINARFWLVGECDSGNPASVSREQVQKWQTEGHVEFLRHRSDIASLYSQSNIVALPSYREGLPKALIEAAACGRAVVTTDEPGCRDAIEPNHTGLLVPARNAIALANAFETLLKDNELRRRMGKAGRALAEREFGIDKVVASHLAIYRELMGYVKSTIVR